MFKRSLRLPAPGKESFFLWGPRQTGKSTLLRAAYPRGFWIDLLKADEFRRYATRPETLREEVSALTRGVQVVIDEVQKVPALLDEVHWLHEVQGARFALCGSSARKVRRGAANLLGGRAVRYELHGLTAGEIGGDFDLDRMLRNGFLPSHYLAERPARLLSAYVGEYLKEEIAAEGLSRSLRVFSEFLEAAALSDGELVSFANIARDTGVSAHTIKSYFQILEDTLLGRWLPAYRKRAKRRVIAAPKWYFADVGVVNHLAHRGAFERRTDVYGKAFESWVLHELGARASYAETGQRLSYWRLASGIEVDFIVGDMHVAIEAKATAKVTAEHLKGLRALAVDHPRVGQRAVVCLEPRRRVTDDGILVLPAGELPRVLASGALD